MPTARIKSHIVDAVVDAGQRGIVVGEIEGEVIEGDITAPDMRHPTVILKLPAAAAKDHIIRITPGGDVRLKGNSICGRCAVWLL